MLHSDFIIGMEFFTGTGRWRCTDIGTRVITAISLEPREMVRLGTDADGNRVEQRYVSDDLADLIGPPYGVAEYVFDEYSMGGCMAVVEIDE
jgi:hypothetical protein